MLVTIRDLKLEDKTLTFSIKEPLLQFTHYKKEPWIIQFIVQKSYISQFARTVYEIHFLFSNKTG